ncbi:MAG: Modification methylase [Verrucomicrobiota bacterium]|jgi:hypothetical protein
MKSAAKVEFGDFQTPLPLAREVCGLLGALGIAPDTIVEPTCGAGAFLIAAAEAFPAARLIGFEINTAHLAAAQANLSSTGHAHVEVSQQDFFSHDWDAEVRERGHVLVLGNPPWVTSAAVAAVTGTNLPAKQNIYGLRGLAAKTGKANFDIAEWMLVRLLQALRGRAATIAVLCKSATAQKVLRHAWRSDLRVAAASLYSIDAGAHFDAAVEACLLVASLGAAGPAEAKVFSDLKAIAPTHRFGVAGKGLVANLDTYDRFRHFEGLCPYQWRSGVKHDCAPILELQPLEDGSFANQLGQTVTVEAAMLYPLLKGTELARRGAQATRRVLLPQTRLGDDTAALARTAPLAWNYLHTHRAAFAARKSSIYAKGPAFAIFGIGDYTFSEWKVAVSALHRPAKFVVIGPWQGRPVVFDDTCYYLPFSHETEARVVAEILNSRPCQSFLEALIFPGSKRAVTVELLQRLNLSTLAHAAGMGDRWEQSRQADRDTDQLPLLLCDERESEPAAVA